MRMSAARARHLEELHEAAFPMQRSAPAAEHKAFSNTSHPLHQGFTERCQAAPSGPMDGNAADRARGGAHGTRCRPPPSPPPRR